MYLLERSSHVSCSLAKLECRSGSKTEGQSGGKGSHQEKLVHTLEHHVSKQVCLKTFENWLFLNLVYSSSTGFLAPPQLTSLPAMSSSYDSDPGASWYPTAMSPTSYDNPYSQTVTYTSYPPLSVMSSPTSLTFTDSNFSEMIGFDPTTYKYSTEGRDIVEVQHSLDQSLLSAYPPSPGPSHMHSHEESLPDSVPSISTSSGRIEKNWGDMEGWFF